MLTQRLEDTCREKEQLEAQLWEAQQQSVQQGAALAKVEESTAERASLRANLDEACRVAEAARERNDAMERELVRVGPGRRALACACVWGMSYVLGLARTEGRAGLRGPSASLRRRQACVTRAVRWGDRRWGKARGSGRRSS